MVCAYDPNTGEMEAGPMATQPSQIATPQTNKRPCLRKTRQTVREGQHLRLFPGLWVCVHTQDADLLCAHKRLTYYCVRVCKALSYQNVLSERPTYLSHSLLDPSK